ncbi:TRAM domain-containing protein [Natrarchaeobius chitinivorans]|uniref:RNA-binding protein n=1 Tax=Natrarchaeobius chitinivorans TaxID=1679083 RepID=A0A3N6P3G1_NATCH|nr:RNA-binding protein [Natrarchaeobius chitinivorans]RQG92249.1 RNA-binding protein [Natrarchaeobius chitinivorans]
MLGEASFVLGAVVTVVFASWLFRRVRGASRSADQRKSWERHRDAQGREPPVDVGDEREAAIYEFTEHHSGERQAVCKVEGFVVFVEDVPTDLEPTDVIRFKVLSFNRGHTSATAAYLGRV